MAKVKDRLLESLKKYAKQGSKHLKNEKEYVWEYYNFFQDFFKKDLTKIEWSEIVKVCNHLHSFNALALAKLKATKEDDNGNPFNHKIEYYQKVFEYLKNGNERITNLPKKEQHQIIFNNLLGHKNEKSKYNESYKLAYFGESSMSELIGQAYVEDYVFYNRRDIKALEKLGFEKNVKEIQKYKSFGDKYLAYNEFINENIRPDFRKVFDANYVKQQNVPENILIEQFFSWVYMNEVFTNENLKDQLPKGKITKLIIRNYNQFKDFELDLTYPKGAKDETGKNIEGNSLDKICLIGQSGTGKTTILNLIFALSSGKKEAIELKKYHDVELHHILTTNENENIKFKTRLFNNEIKTEVEINKKLTDKSTLDFQMENAFPRLMYLPADTIQQTSIFEEKIKDDIDIIDDEKLDVLDFRYTNNGQRNSTVQILWDKVSKKVADYRKEEVEWSFKISTALNKSGIEEATRLNKDFQNWKAANSPFTEFKNAIEADFLDEFNLRLIDDAQSAEDIQHIQFASKNEDSEVIPIKNLSTGTRQVLIKTLPFWALRDKDEKSVVRPFKSIILIDEPENSLYPNKQKLIVKHFQETLTNKKDNDCQFFYATHSPVLLSSFDPWEIVVLENINGAIKQKKHYKGERHIDNYSDFPKYLRWDDILEKYLGVIEEGGENRDKAIQRIAQIKQRLKYLNGNDEQEKTELFEEYEENATLLNWKIK